MNRLGGFYVKIHGCFWSSLFFFPNFFFIPGGLKAHEIKAFGAGRAP